MDRAREVGVTGEVRWVWSDVIATTRDGVTVLQHLGDGTTLTVRNGRLIRGLDYQSAPRRVRHQLARVGGILRLRDRGKYFLHASGAVDPTGGAWLLTGDTGAGKSTLAFALSRAGWSILGDDGIIIEQRDATMVVHPWRDPLRVSLGLSARYPALERSTETPDANDLRRRVPMHAPLAGTARIAGILLLHHASDHAFSRVSAQTALGALVRQSPWVLLGDAAAAEHYRALHRLVLSVPVFHLTHSAAQLDTIAATLRDAA